MFDEIDVLIRRLLNCDVKNAKKSLETLLLKLEKLKGDQKFQEFLLSLRKEAKVFFEDFHHSQFSSLREDWLRICIYDLQRLRRKLLVLQELLRSGVAKTEEPEAAKLLKEIYEEGGMSESTWLLVVNHPSLRDSSSETRKALLRLSSLLQELRTIKNERDC